MQGLLKRFLFNNTFKLGKGFEGTTMRRRRFIFLAVVLVAGAALAIAVWRPWQARPAPVSSRDPDPPADTAAVTVLKRAGGPCAVEIRGTSGGASNLASASLAAGEARSISLRFPAPYTIEAVTVTRDGPPQRRDVRMTLAGGQRYELLINEDDTVAVAPTPH